MSSPLRDRDAPAPELTMHTQPPGESRSRNYIRGLLTAYLVMLASILVSFWLKPFSLRFVSREEYAIFVLGSDLLVALSLLDFGMTAGLRAQVAQLTGRTDPLRLSRLASSAIFSQLFTALLILVAGSGLALYAPSFFEVSRSLNAQTKLLLFLLTLSAALSFATRPFGALLMAFQQTHVDNLIQLALLLIRTSLVVLLLVLGLKMLALAVAASIASLIVALLSVARCYKTIPGLSISYKLVSPGALWRNMKSLNAWFGMGNLAGIVIQNLDRVVAARFVSVESVTTLTLTAQVYILTGMLLAQMTTTALPGLGQLIGLNRLQAAFEAYRQLFLVSTGAAIVAALSLWSGNAAFVTRWVGTQNYGGVMLDTSLALSLLVVAWTLPFRAVLAACLMARPQAIVRMMEAILNLCLSILLTIKFGLIGVVISTVLAGVLTSCWYLPRLVAQYFQCRAGKMLWQLSSPLVWPTLILLPLAYVMRRFAFASGGYPRAFAAMAMVGGCGFLLLWLFAFDRGMRSRLLSWSSGTHPA
jgi:O-antigen/teichoic acid export membrane protein